MQSEISRILTQAFEKHVAPLSSPKLLKWLNSPWHHLDGLVITYAQPNFALLVPSKEVPGFSPATALSCYYRPDLIYISWE